MAVVEVGRAVRVFRGPGGTGTPATTSATPAIVQPTAPLQPPKKVELVGDLVGRGLGTADGGRGARGTPASQQTSPSRDVPVAKNKTAGLADARGSTGGILRGPAVLKSVQDEMDRHLPAKHMAPPLLKKIQQEAAAAAAVAASNPGGERTERGQTAGLPRRGIGFDGGLKRRGHRSTQRGQQQILSMNGNNHPEYAHVMQQKMSTTQAVKRSSMSIDPASKTMIVPQFQPLQNNVMASHLAYAAAGRQSPLRGSRVLDSPTKRLDNPPLRGEMGRAAWKRWTPPYRTEHTWRRPWQQETDGGAMIKEADSAVFEGALPVHLDAHGNNFEGSQPSLSRPASVGQTWFQDADHRMAASYFDTPLWSRAKEAAVTPFWMQPDLMAKSSVYGFPPSPQGTTVSRRQRVDLDTTLPATTSSTSSGIHPRMLRSLDNKELRHHLARAGVWSVEPLATCPRPELLALARQHMEKLGDIKKDGAYKDCKKFGKPGSVTDKYRVAFRKSDSVGVFGSLSAPDAVPTEPLEKNDGGKARHEDAGLIADVEAAQLELEKSIAAVAKAKRRSEMARVRLALANGDPAAALRSAMSTGMTHGPFEGQPDVLSLDEDKGDGSRIQTGVPGTPVASAAQSRAQTSLSNHAGIPGSRLQNLMPGYSVDIEREVSSRAHSSLA